MEKRENIGRKFAENKPNTADDSVQLQQKQYNRDKAMLEAVLDVRDMLGKLSIAVEKINAKQQYEDLNMGDFDLSEGEAVALKKLAKSQGLI